MKELKELADFVLDLGNGISASLADGKIGFSDAYNFKDAMFSLLPAIKGISQVDEEFFDLDDAGKEELKAHIIAKLQLDASHKDAEVIVESVLGVIVNFNVLIGQLVGAKAPSPEA